MLPSIGRSIRALSALFVAASWLAANAQTEGPEIKVVSLCASGEQTIMAGRMKQVKRSAKGTTFVPNGKFASLCANSINEPIVTMVYRYGKPGAIEMEEAASKERKFFVYYESGGPNFGTNIVWFTKGEYRYAIGAAVGMGKGVSVDVYKGSKGVAELFSDLEEEDHYSNTYGIDFDAPKSPALLFKDPDK